MLKLAEVSKGKKKVDNEEPLKVKLADLQSRLSFAKEDLATTDRKIASIRTEKKHFATEIAQLVPLIEKASSIVDAMNRDIGEKEAKVFTAEDIVFRDFCARIGVTNIREYEELQVKRAKEMGLR